MSRLSKEEIARFSGANWLLDFAKEHGLEEAEKELERRGIKNMPLKLNNSDVDVFVNTERENIYKCLLINTIATLYDEFDFEEEQCNLFIERWNTKVACVADDIIRWQDLRQQVFEDLGIWIPLSKELTGK